MYPQRSQWRDQPTNQPSNEPTINHFPASFRKEVLDTVQPQFCFVFDFAFPTTGDSRLIPPEMAKLKVAFQTDSPHQRSGWDEVSCLAM